MQEGNPCQRALQGGRIVLSTGQKFLRQAAGGTSQWNLSRSLLWMQELMAKGLTSDDINHGLRSVFGEDMRIAIPAADEEDEEVTVDTRFGVLHGLAASLRKLDVMSFGRPGLQAELVPALASAGHPRHCFHVRRGFDIWFANPPDPRHHLLEGALK